MRFFLPLVGLLPLALLAATTHAAITYVDAEGRFAGVGNTTVNGADISLGTNIGPSGGGDQFWYIRPNGDGTAAPIFNGIDGWEVDSSSTVFEVTEPLVTTISGLTPGETYNLYGFFWAHTNENQYYDAAFRVGSTGSFSEFDKLNTTAATAADFTNTEMALETLAGGWILRTASLGQHAPTGDTVEIYVQGPDRDLSAYDPLPNGFNATTNPNAAQRTEYDGVGYELVQSLVAGDFDGDGDVDGADFVVWQTNFPTATGATLATGDADGDGDVDGADFVVWQTNFPTTPGPGTVSVPEPASWLLAILSILGFLTFRPLKSARR